MKLSLTLIVAVCVTLSRLPRRLRLNFMFTRQQSAEETRGKQIISFKRVLSLQKPSWTFRGDSKRPPVSAAALGSALSTPSCFFVLITKTLQYFFSPYTGVMFCDLRWLRGNGSFSSKLPPQLLLAVCGLHRSEVSSLRTPLKSKTLL